MKELTTYNRVAGYLNKLYDLLNQEFFEGTLSRPTLTIQSTPKAYGHFSLRDDTWISKKGATHEINIGAGTLARPIEDICATLLHEMVHYHNYVNGIQDCSRGGTYHNRRFRDSAEAHGLIVDHHEKYGWTITSPSDELLQFCLDNDLTDILINRNEFYGIRVPVGGTGSITTTPLPLEDPAPGSTCALAAATPYEPPKTSTSAVWTAVFRWFWQAKRGEHMMFLKRFWKGDVAPGEGRYHPAPEYSNTIQAMERCEDKLRSRLNEEDFRTFREFADAALDSSYLESCDNFCDGFRLGALMMMDVLIGSGYGMLEK